MIGDEVALKKPGELPFSDIILSLLLFFGK